MEIRSNYQSKRIKMKTLKYSLIICAMFAVIYGCGKKDSEFREFFGGKEITYTGAVGDVTSQPGDLRVGLKWKASTDPSITKYVVYWNNKADSQIVNITEKRDTISTVISGLREYVYSFAIYSFDAKGNKSIAKEVNNVKVYGPIYNGTLLNRAYDVENAFNINRDGSVKLNFITPDTINITTEIRYTTTTGENKTTQLSPDSNSITLPNVKIGSVVTYKSFFIPERTSIDTFAVADYSDYPTIEYRYVKCNKSQFAEVSRSLSQHDVGVYDPGSTQIKRLWDNSNGPQAFPDIYHSDGDHPLPHQLTFDLGQQYENLGQMEETGRNCCNNPDRFEIWGISELQGHDTSKKPNEAGWEDEMRAKGWVLLKDVVRTDDGQQPYKFDLNTASSSIRYIRMRIKHVTTGDGTYSNMSEVTFWNKQ